MRRSRHGDRPLLWPRRAALALPLSILEASRRPATAREPAAEASPRDRGGLAGTVPVTARADLVMEHRSPGTEQRAVHRKADVVVADCSAPRLLFGSRIIRAGGEILPPDPFTIDGVALWTEGSAHAVTFDGRRAVRLIPGAIVASDPLPLRLRAGQRIRTDVRVSVERPGQVWPVGARSLPALGEGVVAGEDAVDPAAPLPSPATDGMLFGPVAIQAVPDRRGPAVGILGSSSFQGVGDRAEAPGWCLGYAARALGSIGCPFARLSVGGDRLSRFLPRHGARQDHLLRTGVTHLVLGLGSNDIAAGDGEAAIAARLREALDWCDGLELRVLLPTYTPRSTSADGWRTLAGQVAQAGDPVRRALNAWIRSGAGLHPAVAGVLDIASYVESPDTPGLWRTDLGVLTRDGTHPSPLGHRLSGRYLAPVVEDLLRRG